MKNTKIIEESCSLWKQSFSYKKILETEKNLFTINVKIDSIDFQSSATLSIFSPNEKKNNVIYSIPYWNMWLWKVWYYWSLNDLYMKDWIKAIINKLSFIKDLEDKIKVFDK